MSTTDMGSTIYPTAQDGLYSESLTWVGQAVPPVSGALRLHHDVTLDSNQQAGAMLEGSGSLVRSANTGDFVLAVGYPRVAYFVKPVRIG